MSITNLLSLHLAGTIMVISVAAVFASFLVSAETVMFIHDPYTMQISGMETEKIKRAGLSENRIIKPVESGREEAVKLVTDFLSASNNQRTIIITSYLYSAISAEIPDPDTYNGKKLFLYGPFFDYGNQPEWFFAGEKILLSGSGDNGALERFSNDVDRVVFHIPGYFFERIEKVQPEWRLMDGFSGYLREKNPEIVITRRPLEWDTAFARSSGTVNVFCERVPGRDNPEVLSEISGKAIFFDHAGTLGKLKRIDPDAGGEILALAFDYSESFRRIIEYGNTCNSGCSVVYLPVYAIEADFQKK